MNQWDRFKVEIERTSQALNILKDVSKSQEAAGSSDKSLAFYANLRLTRGLDYAEKMFQKSLLWRGGVFAGTPLAKHVLKTKSPPKAKQKAWERAARLFISMRRAPTKPLSWWAKNYKHIQLLMESRNWPDRSESSTEESIDKVGPFTVHNTVGEDPSSTHKAILRAAQFVQTSRVPKLKGVLYGDVYIVGKLQEPRTLAWYYPSEDKVYLRKHLKVGKGEVHNLIHELGHRYWYRNMLSTAQKALWMTHHRSVKDSASASVAPADEEFKRRLAEFDALSVGDKFPGLYAGWVRGVKVVELDPEGREGWVVLKKGREKFFPRRMVEKDLKSNVARVSQGLAIQKGYPTPYASTDAEEHFCEALAMFCMGTLPLEHQNAFESIVIRGERP